MINQSFLSTIRYPESVVTAIASSPTFPEFVEGRFNRYVQYLDLFGDLIRSSNSSADLLDKIRNPLVHKADVRMSLLKLFRRCVSTVIDTEKSKKLKIPTSDFVNYYGHTFKDINILKRQFTNMPDKEKYALTSLIGEYDDRGHQGYILTDLFFSWFEDRFSRRLTIRWKSVV